MASGTVFKGFPAEGMAFLRDLKENNDREWFAPRKEIYEEQVRRPMLQLLSAVHAGMLSFAPGYVGEPKKCIYRIYRDTRFAKDKTPYKTHIAASLWSNAIGKQGGAGFYFSIAPDEIEIGGGLYAPEPQLLLAVRRHIAEDHEAFRETLTTELWGERAPRAPKGFDPAHPAIDLIRHKHFILLASPKPALATTSKLLPEIVRNFKAMTPFIEFLNQPLLAQAKAAEGRKALL
jgi:uncharacterized protein (TIGR02453 family)